VRDALLEPWIADYRSTTIRDEELLEIAEPDRSREDVIGRHAAAAGRRRSNPRVPAANYPDAGLGDARDRRLSGE
jgi:hypothetical protein